jgi:putative hydrolase of HD superfamily
MTTSDLQNLIEFIAFTHEIRKVKRAMLLEDYQTNENDAEHCYQLALTAWYLIEKDNLKLDQNKVISIALIHDVAEAYAGDTTAFASAEDRSAHAKREAEAIAKLKSDWPAFTSMHELIEEYELRKTDEAKFVYALDKLVPIINNYIYEGKAWKVQGITLDRVKEIKAGKVDLSEVISKYYKDLVMLLEAKPELFAV